MATKTPLEQCIFTHFHHSAEGETITEAAKAELAKLRADARALWAVRVLDAEHVETNTAFPLYAELSDDDSMWLVEGRDGAGPIGGSHLTADAARLAAAEAIWPSLPQEARERLVRP